MNAGMFVIMLTASMLSLMPGISVSLFSARFYLESQSSMKRTVSGL